MGAEHHPLEADDQPANDPANLDPPINQVHIIVEMDRYSIYNILKQIVISSQK